MIISSKGRYALRVMVYLAVHHSDEYIPLMEQRVSYLERQLYGTFAGNLGTKVEKRNEKNRENRQECYQKQIL